MTDTEMISQLNLGMEQLKSGKNKEAEEIFLKILKINPNDNNSLHLLGYLNAERGDVDEGILLINKSLSIFPNFPEALINLGNAYLRIKKYANAINSFQKALSLKKLPAIWTALGNVYLTKVQDEINATGGYSSGDIDNAKMYYEMSISSNLNDPTAYNNLGIIAIKKGKRDEAKHYFMQAINLNKNFVDANCNLNSLMLEMVPSWHIGMMNDSGRNDALLRAIKDVVNKGDFIFEVGSGSGILSMMSIEQGADRVISCESSSEIASVAEKVIKKNGFEKKIKIINKNSNNINVGTDLPGRADVIISEILSAEFVGEEVLSSLYDVKRRLLKENGKMIPESGSIMISLLGENDIIKENLYVDEVHGFDLSDFNSVINRKHGIKYRPSDINLISDPIEVFHFNFYDEEIFLKKTIDLDIKINNSSKCYGVITWNKLNLSQNITYENHPKKLESHWVNPVYLFEKPIEVKKDQKVAISCSIEKDRTWYNLR